MHPTKVASQRCAAVAKGAYIHLLTGCSYRDIEIRYLTAYLDDAEFIKRRPCTKDSRFHTFRARGPKNRWRTLYRCAGSDEPGFERFKIDTLVAGG